MLLFENRGAIENTNGIQLELPNLDDTKSGFILPWAREILKIQVCPMVNSYRVA